MLLAFGGLVALFVVVAFFGILEGRRVAGEYQQQTRAISQTKAAIVEMRRYEREFLTYDVRGMGNPEFFEDNDSHALRGWQNELANLRAAWGSLDTGRDPEQDQIAIEFNEALESYEELFLTIKARHRELGAGDFGAVGRLRASSRALETFVEGDDHKQALLFASNVHEKDFLLTYDLRYVELFNERIRALRSELSPMRRSSLAVYRSGFHKAVEQLVEIGLTEHSGLRHELHAAIDAAGPLIDEHIAATESRLVAAIERSVAAVLGTLFVCALVAVCLAVCFARFVGRPVHRLTEQMESLDSGGRLEGALRRGPREIVAMSACFVRMAERRQAMEDEIRQKNITLQASLVEQGRSVTELEAMTEEANAANRAKSDFIANMSHEIRTPMSAILGYTEMLERSEAGEEIDQSSGELVLSIRRNADHLLEIINDILDTSKIEAGRMTVERIPTDVGETVEYVDSLLRARCEEKGVSLRVERGDAVPDHILSDPTRLRQILVNIIGNAIKFTNEGEIALSVGYESGTHQIVFEIADTGIGMSPEALERVRQFDAFQQADTTMSRRFGGTGLGLRISNSLATMMGGSLTVDSHEGVGTTFVVTIDAGTPEELEQHQLDQSDSGKEAANASIEGLRVLVAEDGADNQRIIRFHLEKSGARVTIVENGRLAVEAIDREPDGYDLILMDMQMPEMDGYTATGMLRGWGCQLPILALTAHSTISDRHLCLDAGCDDHITKPIKREVLVERCAHWHRAKQVPRAA